MKVQEAKTVHYDSGPNMTPLVDIVMVILIFLLLAGTFVGLEHVIKSTLPKSGSSGPGPQPTTPDPALQIFVDSDGSGYTAHPAGLPPVHDRASLRDELVKARLQLGKSTPNDKGNLVDSTTQIRISPDQSVKWQVVIDVYQSALEAGFTKVGFDTAH